MACSSVESEYKAMVATTSKLICLSHVMGDIGFTYAKPIQLLCDNTTALHMSINQVFHKRMKHPTLDYHFVWEKVADDTHFTRYLPSSQQVADVFTKPLSRQSFIGYRFKLGVHQITLSSLSGLDKIDSHTLDDSMLDKPTT